MNPISSIKSLFDESDRNGLRYLKRDWDGNTYEETFLEELNFIEASNTFLSEIKLQLVEIGDFNKDKHKIQSLFEKFEFNLIQRYKYYGQLIIN